MPLIIFGIPHRTDWIADKRRIYVHPIRLEKNTEYGGKLNIDGRFMGFKSKDGVPLKEYEYSFKTGDQSIDENKRKELRKELDEQIKSFSETRRQVEETLLKTPLMQRIIESLP